MSYGCQRRCWKCIMQRLKLFIHSTFYVFHWFPYIKQSSIHLVNFSIRKNVHFITRFRWCLFALLTSCFFKNYSTKMQIDCCKHFVFTKNLLQKIKFNLTSWHIVLSEEILNVHSKNNNCRHVGARQKKLMRGLGVQSFRFFCTCQQLNFVWKTYPPLAVVSVWSIRPGAKWSSCTRVLSSRACTCTLSTTCLVKWKCNLAWIDRQFSFVVGQMVCQQLTGVVQGRLNILP